MTRLPRRDYRPVNHGRCPLCSAVEDEDHVEHPLGDVLVWLWKAHAAWRVLIVAVPVLAILVLAAVITSVRALLAG